MCTAVSFRVKDSYFGRNLDYFHQLGEAVVITPRKYKFSFCNGDLIDSHYAMIGMAVVSRDYPLYFDATNEKGLSVAGLNFPENAYYNENQGGKDNIASFEFIPWILSQCGSVSEAESLMDNLNITNECFSDEFTPTPLHWMISDGERDITVEQTIKGLNIYNNPVGVLTNNPVFEMQMFNLNNYMNVSSAQPENLFSDKVNLNKYSLGLGGLGLPGDLSSASRFVRATFTKLNSVCEPNEVSSVSQFFHILYSVHQQRGCVKADEGFEITNYSSCCNINRGIYYYTTYNNLNINSVAMFKEDLNSEKLIVNSLKNLCDFLRNT